MIEHTPTDHSETSTTLGPAGFVLFLEVENKLKMVFKAIKSVLYLEAFLYCVLNTECPLSEVQL